MAQIETMRTIINECERVRSIRPGRSARPLGKVAAVLLHQIVSGEPSPVLEVLEALGVDAEKIADRLNFEYVRPSTVRIELDGRYATNKFRDDDFLRSAGIEPPSDPL